MYRAIWMLALPGFALGAEAPTWRTDYVKAGRDASAEQKPLAVVLGSGPRGWQHVARNGEISKSALAMLAERYTPVYIDVKTAEGKVLAKAFEMPTGTGIVLSDYSGTVQA